MSKKFSSFDEQQLITENFRKFINEIRDDYLSAFPGAAGEHMRRLAKIVKSRWPRLVTDYRFKKYDEEGQMGYLEALGYITDSGFEAPEDGKKSIKPKRDHGFQRAVEDWKGFLSSNEGKKFMKDNSGQSLRKAGVYDEFEKWLAALPEPEKEKKDGRDDMSGDMTDWFMANSSW